MNALKSEIESHRSLNQSQYYSWDKNTTSIYYPENVNVQCKPTPNTSGMACFEILE